MSALIPMTPMHTVTSQVKRCLVLRVDVDR